MSLPPNTTPLLQPMHQGIIETLKKLHTKQFLRRLLSCDGDENDVSSSFKFKECAYILNDSWSSIKAKTFHKAWRKMFGKNH
jgi:hypothetical protein